MLLPEESRRGLVVLMAAALAAVAGSSAARTVVAADGGCAWDQPRLAPAARPALPEGKAGPLASALIGSWQHTFIDTGGAGYEPTGGGTDIRFVFPDAATMLYCQNVVMGAVKIGPRERSAALGLEGDRLVLPGAPGYTALAWSKDVMLWRNERNPKETYLLQRR
jgi:hypothetical protein